MKPETEEGRKTEAFRRIVADALERHVRTHLLEPRRSQYKFTFIARLDGNPEADIVVTEDRAADLRALLDRTEAREPK